MTLFGVNRDELNQAFQEICDGLTSLAKSGIVASGKTDKAVNSDQGAQAAINGVDRTPWIMTTTEWMNPVNTEGVTPPPRALVWNANPADVTWTMAQRSMHTKNLYGTVLHVWPNTRRETFYDEFRLHMNFQSGSLMPVFIVDQVQKIKRQDGSNQFFNVGRFEPSGGLANFYDFLQLVDAPKLTTATESQPARANLVNIHYNSNLFPQLTLIGMFDSNGITFTDTSQDPNQVMGWSADFIVYDSMPRLSANSNLGQQSNLTLIDLWKRVKIDQSPSVAQYSTLNNPPSAPDSTP